MKILHLSKRWPHHTASGGYDQLACQFDSVKVQRRCRPGVVISLGHALWRRLYVNPYLVDYRFGDFVAEWKAFVRATVGRVDILHVLYGDEQLNALLRLRRALPCSLIATFHLPSHRVAERFEKAQRDSLRKLDGAIVVSRAQLPAFRQWLGEEKVRFIPHGVHTRVFHPAPVPPPEGILRLLFVGTHMRDFDLAHRVIDHCTSEKIPVHLSVVTDASSFHYFTGCDGVTLRSGVSQEELVSLYQSAHALFLPVRDATANNAVLESLACGTPVITTNVGGMPDYVDASCGWLLAPGDVEAAVRLVRQLAREATPALRMRAAARSRAETFSWECIGQECRAAYECLLSSGCINRRGSAGQESDGPRRPDPVQDQPL